MAETADELIVEIQRALTEGTDEVVEAQRASWREQRRMLQECVDRLKARSSSETVARMEQLIVQLDATTADFEETMEAIKRLPSQRGSITSH